MTRTLTLLMAALVATTCTCQEQAPEALFQSATASFVAGDYQAAEWQFRACLDALGDDPTVDYNLAMTFLRLEQPGRARAFLERAAQLAPGDREIARRLQLVLTQLDQTPPPPASWLHALWARAKGRLTAPQAVGLTATLNLLAALFLGLWLLTKRRRFGLAGLVAAGLALGSWPLAWAKVTERTGPPRAIVVETSVALRGGPGESFGELQRLAEGAVVTLRERPGLRFGPGLSVRTDPVEKGLWCEVRTASGARGYVRGALIESARPSERAAPAASPQPPSS